ncbi:hypothetical protein pdam_00019932 [Pocillopora damicornis]|uniref:C2 domain-containing protein n=1 Tax=Pocillopora damicornis TaxID=46731 RepID=A0A3M6TGQ6_POCDA|nr:hypothetical protein pdam_00019932 [Pocillopora damicornis]
MAERKAMPSFKNKIASEDNIRSSLQSKLVQNGHVTLQTNAFQNKRKVELFIECTDLVQLDTFSRTDPMCVLYAKRLGQWMEYGRTESIPNMSHPKFVETFIIEANSTVYPRLRFSVFDLANFTSKDLRKHDFVGSIEIELDALLESSCGTLIRTLRVPGDVKSRGYIHIYVDDVRDDKTNVRLHFGATNLEKKGLLGKCDSFFEVNRLLPRSNHHHPVYRSEVVTRTACPKSVTRGTTRVKNATPRASSPRGLTSLKLTFPLFGSLHRAVKQVDIVNPKKQIKNKRYSNSGILRILHCYVDKQFSLIDYVRGNCIIRMVCAIDFTISNGPPLTQDSLHTMDEEKNEYSQTLKSIGKVLSSFEKDKKIAAYGFGAQACSTGALPYMFALDSETGKPELENVEAVVDAYWKRLEDVKLGGPTHLAPIIQGIAAYAEKEVSQCSQHYTIGLVIVDGIVNDVDHLIDVLVDVERSPLSIVVVGVGPADFRLMNELFSRNRRQLRSKGGKTASRINTDFLSLRRHAANPGVNDSMARDVFANISQQIVTFFKSKGIVPNLPTKMNVMEPFDDCNNLSDASSRPSSPRVRKISPHIAARCPTCGSVIDRDPFNMLSL